MLTALTVKSQTNEKLIPKILNTIRGNRLILEYKSARGVVLKHITYKNRTGKINWNKIDKAVGAQRNHLLCDSDIQLPEDRGFKSFDNKDYKSRLATNMAISVVSNLKEPEKFKIGIFDVKGECADILSALIQYTSNLVVISDNLKEYKFELDNIYHQTGATVQLTSNRIHLVDCNLVIAPTQITERLPLSEKTIVLTNTPPTICTSGFVYYDYFINLPSKFALIKPRELSDVYFAGALYQKAGLFQLGSIVPVSCKNCSSAQTCRSICDTLEKYVQ